VIIDFVRARNRSHVAQVHQELSKERETRLTFTLSDCVMLAYVVAAAAFYAAVAWFLLS
jgi:hypothetical protein